MRVLSLVVICSLAAMCAAPLTAADKKASVPDDKIYDDVRLRLASDSQVKGGALTVEVDQGVVTLAGKVKTEKQKDRAERLTKKVRGVTKVVNKLTVEP